MVYTAVEFQAGAQASPSAINLAEELVLPLCDSPPQAANMPPTDRQTAKFLSSFEMTILFKIFSKNREMSGTVIAVTKDVKPRGLAVASKRRVKEPARFSQTEISHSKLTHTLRGSGKMPERI